MQACQCVYFNSVNQPEVHIFNSDWLMALAFWTLTVRNTEKSTRKYSRALNVVYQYIIQTFIYAFLPTSALKTSHHHIQSMVCRVYLNPHFTFCSQEMYFCCFKSLTVWKYETVQNFWPHYQREITCKGTHRVSYLVLVLHQNNAEISTNVTFIWFNGLQRNTKENVNNG